jgi:endo-1,4-beta-xylanase
MTSLGLSLSACGIPATSTPTPAPLPTSVLLPTTTLTPTATLTPTLTPTPTNTSKPTKTLNELTPRELADAAAIKYGTAIGFLFDTFDKRRDKRFMGIVQRDFNSATIHNGAYWRGYEPEQGKEDQCGIWFVGRQIDALHEVGINDIRWHPLVYPKYSPQWLHDGVIRGSIKKDQLVDFMKRHIISVVTRFRSDVTEWIVVNEPYRHYSEDDDYFQTVIGDEYIDMAFQVTRDLDSKARLIFNDTLNHATSGYHSIYQISQAFHTQQTRNIVSRLKAKGLIDGVGLQMHLDGANPPDKDNVIRTMQSYTMKSSQNA